MVITWLVLKEIHYKGFVDKYLRKRKVSHEADVRMQFAKFPSVMGKYVDINESKAEDYDFETEIIESKNHIELPAGASSLKELEGLIDDLFYNVHLLSTENSKYIVDHTQIVNSTPPQKRAGEVSITTEARFLMFKEKVEYEITNLLASKHDLCKLGEENLKLVARISELEGFGFFRKLS